MVDPGKGPPPNFFESGSPPLPPALSQGMDDQTSPLSEGLDPPLSMGTFLSLIENKGNASATKGNVAVSTGRWAYYWGGGGGRAYK